MKQSIVALIRPKLNLAQKESEAAHLIEHILVAPKRMEALGITADFYAQNIIFHNGTVNDYYMAEYYVVMSEVAEKMAKILLDHKNELYLSKEEFEKIKSSLLEEISGDKGEFIDLDEQYAKAIYTSDSPSIRNPWHDLNAAQNISYEEIIEIFKKYNTDISLLNLSFDNYQVENLPTLEKNQYQENTGLVKLTHPWQSTESMDTYLVTLLKKNEDLLIGLIYRRSLTDFRFGLLFDELRNKNGLVYDISVDADYNDTTMGIYFTSSEDTSKKARDIIIKSLENYNNFIKENLKYIQGRLKFDIELGWGDVQNLSSGIIDQVVSGGYTEPPIDLIKRIDSITVEKLCELNQLFLDKLKQEAIIVNRNYGKEVDKKIVSEEL